MANGDDLNGDTPAWLKVLVRFGGYAAIAFFLIWFLTSKVDSSMNRQDHDHETLKFYLRQVCLNTAKDEAGARLCYQQVKGE